MFKQISSSVRFPEQEEQVLKFWSEQGIYEKSLEQRADAEPFVFYEGPPTANGLPHPGHCLTRAIKDVFPRYKTMRGFRCERKAGWDTHGLPVEVEVCKELGIHGKDEIEAFGIEPFIHKCQQSVWRYMREWERLTERLGFWIDLSEAYVTYHKSYVESVWWSLKQLFDQGKLYRGHKIVWWWAQGGTALSAGEVGQGYREVADPSLYVKFPLVEDPKTSLVVWTTTPWTMPSNTYTAVHPEIEYAVCSEEGTDEKFIVAAGLVDSLSDKLKRTWSVDRTMLGKELIGQRYEPPTDTYYSKFGDAQGSLKDGTAEHLYWRVVPGDFVTTGSGTGLVHCAPAFGEDDYGLLVSELERFDDSGDLPGLLCAVGSDGKFTSDYPDQAGVWVKDADKAIARSIRDKGRLLLLDQYLHDYPFCWRAAQDPLIQYPRESWFIKTTDYRDRMLENNAKIGWLPENIRDGRFGNFLESNVDWALSRERYWGTPLPIWECEESGKREAVACFEELHKKPGVTGFELWEEAKAENPELPDDLKVHKPYIDAIVYDSPFVEGAKMHRVPEVIDCWYDSGAMPFAQWGYPHQNKERFEEAFPADFISEAIDQTRGWFYSQLAISTMLFGQEEKFPHPFRNCIVLGLMLSEWWQSKDGKQIHLSEAEAQKELGKKNVEHKIGKMSKQLRNYPSPQEIFDEHGADALRWYFFANQPPWSSIIYSERSIRDSIPEFMLRMWNVLSFFTMYAELDEFQGPAEIKGTLDQLTSAELSSAATYRPVSERGELDRWILAELSETIGVVTERMDEYDNYAACQRINALVDSLSNWYVRRGRDRCWGEEKAVDSQDKADIYWTLYETLVELTKVVAPFVPFLAESMWQILTAPVQGKVRESVHLCDYPGVQPEQIDSTLASRMQLLREIASLGRSARMSEKLRVRQPLAQVQVTLASDEHLAWLSDHDGILKDELNVKEIVYNVGSSEYIEYQILPNFKALGPRIGKKLPLLKKSLQQVDGASLMQQLQDEGVVKLDLEGEELSLDPSDIEVRLKSKEGWAAAQGKFSVVVLSTELTPDLVLEGYARDIVRLIQETRKQRDCKRSDRIHVFIVTEDAELKSAVTDNRDYIANETLAMQIDVSESSVDSVELDRFEIEGKAIQVGLQVVQG